MRGRKEQLSGRRFGLLSVNRDTRERKRGQVLWECVCDCGRITSVSTNSLLRGQTRSCGCLRGRNRSHGMSRTDVYKIWDGMRYRCGNPASKDWPKYGGRGIRVCVSWDASFEAFHADMGPRPSPRHTIDRIDNDGNYEPGNCRWATAEEQTNNTRGNKRVTAFGKSMTVAQWAKETGMSQTAIYQRLYYGWPPARALTEPVRKKAS